VNTVQGPNGPHLVEKVEELADLNHDGKVSRSEAVIAAAAGVLILASTVLLGAFVVGLLGVCGG
jgi:hypothetical protein